MARRMISIASAPGWKARYLPDGTGEDPRVVMLVSWALVENGDGSTEIVGVVQRTPTAATPSGALGFADEVKGFDGYTFTGLTTRPAET